MIRSWQWFDRVPAQDLPIHPFHIYIGAKIVEWYQFSFSVQLQTTMNKQLLFAIVVISIAMIGSSSAGPMFKYNDGGAQDDALQRSRAGIRKSTLNVHLR